MRHVVVVGAGLAGLAIGALLARRGFSITVVEATSHAKLRRDDMVRSINLALSARGIRTLDALGLTDGALRMAVPMYGRRIHLADGFEDFQRYDLVGDRAIHSIRRSSLWKWLLAACEASGATIRYGARCLDVDGDARALVIADDAGRTSRLDYDALIGCDGAHSAVRSALVRRGVMTAETRRIRHGYLEASVPAAHAASLARDGLHVWPRADHMLLALPNVDGSFSATVFMPLAHDDSNRDASTRDALQAVFRERFADALGLAPGLPVALAQNPIRRLFTTKCHPWSHAGSVLLLGDAAHTMAPFYGQGMNCALEDCLLLMESVERCAGKWPQAFADFELRRRPDADAITTLSEANYLEMSRRVVGYDHKLRRAIERALQTRFPSTFVPLYEMVSFSTIPYADAARRGALQTAIVERLATDLDDVADLDLEQEWLTRTLDAA